jgi:hypothetical protein
MAKNKSREVKYNEKIAKNTVFSRLRTLKTWINAVPKSVWGLLLSISVVGILSGMRPRPRKWTQLHWKKKNNDLKKEPLQNRMALSKYNIRYVVTFLLKIPILLAF